MITSRQAAAIVAYLALGNAAIATDGLLDAPLVGLLYPATLALGLVVPKWWLPLVLVGLLPALASPCAYGECEPNLSNGLVAVLVAGPFLVALALAGVVAGRPGRSPTRTTRSRRR